MKKTLFFTTILIVLSLMLSACGSLSVGIQLPGGEDGSGGGNQQVTTNILLYVLLGVTIVIVLAALFRRKP